MDQSYADSLSQLSIPYEIRNGVVSWHGHPLQSADPVTFTGLSHVWGMDKVTIFTEWRPRRIHRASFEFLNSVYVKDKDHVYDYCSIIEGADPQTFTCLDAGLVSEDGAVTNQIWARGYGRDKRAVYYHDQMTGNASPLKGANPATFVSLGNRYGRDDATVFYEKLRLPSADPSKWFYLGHSYSTDTERVYYFNRVICGISIEGFRVMRLPLKQNYATDGKVFLRGDAVIAESDFDMALSKAISQLPSVLIAFKKGHCMSTYAPE